VTETAEWLTFANELADSVKPIVLSYFRRRLSIEHKLDGSPVTEADRAIETKIRNAISQRYPAHGVFGEEYGRTEGASRYTWVIDPIDGTKSFITGVPLFGTLIALLDSDRPILGVIDIPALGERWVASAGEITRFNDIECRSSDCIRLRDAALYATSVDMFEGDDRKRFEAVSRAANMRRFSGDCYAYGLLAAGFIDLVVEADLQPYDFLALVPVVEGAGGVITDWAGNPLGIESDGRVIAAATPALHAEVVSMLARNSHQCAR